MKVLLSNAAGFAVGIAILVSIYLIEHSIIPPYASFGRTVLGILMRFLAAVFGTILCKLICRPNRRYLKPGLLAYIPAAALVLWIYLHSVKADILQMIVEFFLLLLISSLVYSEAEQTGLPKEFPYDYMRPEIRKENYRLTICDGDPVEVVVLDPRMRFSLEEELLCDYGDGSPHCCQKTYYVGKDIPISDCRKYMDDRNSVMFACKDRAGHLIYMSYDNFDRVKRKTGL